MFNQWLGKLRKGGIPFINLIYDSKKNPPTTLYPTISDVEGTLYVTDTFVEDNGYIGVPYKIVDSATGEIEFNPTTGADYLGGSAIAPYCKLRMPELSSLDIFNRIAPFDIYGNAIVIWNEDNTKWDGFAVDGDEETYRDWGASTFMLGNEFLYSLNIEGWQVFVQLRSTDGALERIVAYLRTENSFYVDKAEDTMLDTFMDVEFELGVNSDFFVEQGEDMIGTFKTIIVDRRVG
jgi:hypothetical protein